MTSDPTAFDQQHDQTPPTQFVPDVPEMIAKFPFPETESPIQSVRELDPLDIGDQEENSDRVRESFDASEPTEFTGMQYSTPEPPEGYIAPQFDRLVAMDDFVGDDLDALFAELSEAAPGQSADIAVWCPWLVNAATG